METDDTLVSSSRKRGRNDHIACYTHQQQQVTTTTNDSNDDHNSSRAAEVAGTATTGSSRQRDVPLDLLLNANFEELARQFPSFGVAWRNVEDRRQASSGRQQQLLSLHITQEFSIELTKALLHVHFGISLSHVPIHHLCPPVPNRYYYVQWIQHELLPLISRPEYFVVDTTTKNDAGPSSSSSSPCPRGGSGYVGLDIGTGAVCIYPLLFAATCPVELDCIMYATDIDEKALEFAKHNVDSNPQYKGKIQLVHVPPSDRQKQQQQQQQFELVEKRPSEATGNSMDVDNIERDSEANGGGDDVLDYPVGPLRQSLESISNIGGGSSSTIASSSPLPPPQRRCLDFCMVNPPFYDIDETPPVSHHHRKSSSNAATSRDPTSMTSLEGNYPGGEYGFALDMLVDGMFLYANHCQQQHQRLAGEPIPPPHWTSLMCGKKTTYIKVRHIVTQLLGPAHVLGTEFGPGQMTRWFLAWNFRRPLIRSPLSKMTTSWQFDVTACSGDHVCARIQVYFESFPDLVLMCTESSCRRRLQVVETVPSPPPWKGDEALPDFIRRILRGLDPTVRMSCLPAEGHFLLDITLLENKKSATTTTTTTVHTEAYQHSLRGKKILEKMQSQLQGEVCRTNRKWRRRLQREQQRPPSPGGATMMMMDE